MKEEFEPEDFEDDDNDEVKYPPDASAWEREFLDYVRGIIPKRTIHVVKGFKPKEKSSMECIYLEEDPVLFPKYERAARQLMEIARDEDPSAEISFDADPLWGTELSLTIKASSFALDSKNAIAEFSRIIENVGSIVIMARTDDRFQIEFGFPKAWRVVK